MRRHWGTLGDQEGGLLVPIRLWTLCLLRKAKAAAAAAVGWAGAEQPCRGAVWMPGAPPRSPPLQLVHLQLPLSLSRPILLGFWAEALGALPYRYVRARPGLGARERSDFCLASCTCAQLCLLTWRPGKQYLMLWVPVAFVVTHLLLNRYKLLVLEILASPSPH